jgi:nucleotide-binding universal stress UspA family protein
MPVIDDRPTVSLNKIMYATNFSPVADQAGNYVKALARRFGSTVEIAHALHAGDDDASLSVHELRKEYARRLNKKQSEFHDMGIKAFVSQSSEYPPADALLLMERQSAPDLIVAGTSSKSALDRFLLGSTAEQLIREAVSPVLTIGPNAKPPKDGPLVFERILLATDFSDASNKAAGIALALAQDSGARLLIVHVPGKESNHVIDKEAERAFLEKLARHIPQEAYEWCAPEYAIEHGKPAQAILNVANRVKADLIVMGARQRSFSLIHLRRGVTQDVLAQAACPVLTVH